MIARRVTLDRYSRLKVQPISIPSPSPSQQVTPPTFSLSCPQVLLSCSLVTVRSLPRALWKTPAPRNLPYFSIVFPSFVWRFLLIIFAQYHLLLFSFIIFSFFPCHHLVFYISSHFSCISHPYSSILSNLRPVLSFPCIPSTSLQLRNV